MTLEEKKNLITKAKDAYYNSGETIMSDFEYDKLVAEVGYESIGAPVLNGFKKINISDKPMLSLNKCHSAEEIKDFAQGKSLVASVKCDGLSCRIIYENGKIISANTRGNGEIGQDITEHIKQFMNVPLIIDYKDRLVVDGEAIIFQNDFEKINKNGEFKNPRNLAAGTLASLDTSLCKNRCMSFIAWDLIEGSFLNYKNYEYCLHKLNQLGFYTVPHKMICFDVENIDDVNKEILLSAKNHNIGCDGVVWKFNDLEFGNSLGRTAHHWCGAIAWKPAMVEYETELIDIEWSMGRTGVLTPVAIFEPVELLGSTIERASLHNLSVMEEILGENPFVGQVIKVYKCNEIIPAISNAQNEKGEWIH